MTTRFIHIINQLKALGKRYSNVEMVRKILRILSKAWGPKVTTIQEAKDLNLLNLDTLIGSLKTHEIELKESFEQTNRRCKSITLKSIHKRSNSSKALKASEEFDEEEEESFDNEDDDEKDEIAHLAERISKAWIRRKKKRGFVPKKDKKGKVKQSKIICFECKEPRYLRSECPKLKKSSKKKEPKKKAMMATWKDLDEE